MVLHQTMLFFASCRHPIMAARRDPRADETGPDQPEYRGEAYVPFPKEGISGREKDRRISFSHVRYE